MSTTRPAAGRKITKTTEKNRDEALDMGLRVTIEGEVYEVRIGDVTSSLARELRARLGCGPMQLIRQTSTDPDIDLISAFVWLARRIKGEIVPFDDVEVSYAQLLAEGFDVELPGAEEPDPEA